MQMNLPGSRIAESHVLYAVAKRSREATRREVLDLTPHGSTTFKA